MKGSIRFNKEINVEVAVDPSQNEGAKLLSAVNLVDGQELGPGGGGGGIRKITITDGTFDITPHQLIDTLSEGNLAVLFEVVDNDSVETNNNAFISIVTSLFYTGEVWRMFMTDPEEGGMYYRESSGYDEPFRL